MIEEIKCDTCCKLLGYSTDTTNEMIVPVVMYLSDEPCDGECQCPIYCPPCNQKLVHSKQLQQERDSVLNTKWNKLLKESDL